MKHWFVFIALMVSQGVIAQKGTQQVREGNNAYEEGDYDAAMEHYQKALELNPDLYEAVYNAANTAYQQQNMEEAATRYGQAANMARTDQGKVAAYHNLGNALLNQKKFKESVEAYKNALRLDPTADDTRYNLSYALQKLREQEQKQNKDKQDKENQDQNKDQKNQQDQNKENKQDKQDEKNKQDQENKENQDQQDKKDGQDKQEQQQQRPEEQKINRQDAERLLDAARNEDKKVLMRLHQKPQKAEQRNIEKDW